MLPSKSECVQFYYFYSSRSFFEILMEKKIILESFECEKLWQERHLHPIIFVGVEINISATACVSFYRRQTM